MNPPLLEMLEARKYYGPHATGWVLLYNGRCEFHGDKSSVLRIKESIERRWA